MWMAISYFCAAYVFLGVMPWVYELYYGHWILGSVAFVAWILNFVLLAYANKRW